MAITLYDPKVETYLCDAVGYVQKVEKIILKEDEEEDNITVSYISVNDFGERTVYKAEDEGETYSIFTMDGNTMSINEESLSMLIEDYDPEMRVDILDNLEEYGVKNVTMKDGSKISFAEYRKQNIIM